MACSSRRTRMRAIGVAATALAGSFLVANAPSASAAPAGFVDTEVADVGSLTTVVGLPDGRVIVLEKTGRVLRVDADGTVDEMADFTDVCTRSERGLLGFAVDPDFTTSGNVYVYRTVPSTAPGGCVNRVSRYTMGEAGIDGASEKILVDAISSVGSNHNGGDIEIGQDGHLYIAVGDAGRDPRGDSGSAGRNDAAQDLSLLNGKILRVDRTNGSAAPGNPFTGPGTADCRVRGNTASTPTTTCREIYAFGLRNPYRFAFDPDSPGVRFFINDVGQGTREEVNESHAGANYGWPMREGRCPQGQNPPCAGPTPGLVDPITDYSHANGLFVTAGGFIPAGVWPSQYDGAYLVADGAFGTMWAWRGGVDLAASEVFLEASAPTDLAFVSTPTSAALWYVQQNGEIHRVVTEPSVAGPLDGSGLARATRIRIR